MEHSATQPVHIPSKTSMFSSLPISQFSTCLHLILNAPHRFVGVGAPELCHRIAKNSNNRTLLVHSMAVNNYEKALRFLIDNNYIDIERFKYSDQVYAAARCNALAVLDLLSSPAQRSEQDTIMCCSAN